MTPTRTISTLTERQQAVLTAFRQLTGQRGAPPSVRAIATHFRIQVSAAHRHLRTLLRKGFLEVRNGLLRLPGSAFLPVPILGRAPAGPPSEALESLEGYLPCPVEWGRGRDVFALRVTGDSMVDAGILDGDIVVCAKTETARSGEIVVASIDGDATIKRLGRSGGVPALVPANPRYKPIALKGDARIIGRILGVFRSLV